jgi:hypothetical protein
MRKKIISLEEHQNVPPGRHWLDIEKLAAAEITSEAEAHPIESALLPGKNSGWRAASPGKQTIRLRFSCPLELKRIMLKFEESTIERTQEYCLRWSADGGQSYQEIVRQQWNFSPAGATDEIENFYVELPAVTVLELNIDPDISGKQAFASLEQMRLA